MTTLLELWRIGWQKYNPWISLRLYMKNLTEEFKRLLVLLKFTGFLTIARPLPKKFLGYTLESYND